MPKVRLVLNLGTKDKQRFGLKEVPALDGDVVDVTKEAAEALKAEGKAFDEGHEIFKEKDARAAKKSAPAGARVMDKTTPIPTTDDDDRPAKETKKK